MIPVSHEHTNRCWWNHEQARWICPGSTGTGHKAQLLREPGRPLVDVRDMIVVHTALLREFRLAPAAVARVGAGEARRAAAVDGHLGFVCDLLHHHHAGEDALLWPKLRGRVPGAATVLIDEVETQHTGIDAALRRVTGARQAWMAQPNAGTRNALVTELGVMHTLLSEHLDFEERAVLPLAASVLTEAEWHAIGDAGVAAIPKFRLPLVFGMFAYEGDPAVLRTMLKTAPPLPRLLLPRIAPRVYARRAARIHGTPAP